MSTALSLLSKRLPKKGKGTRVLFSENAADNIPGDHFWVKNDKKAFTKMGCEVNEIDLRWISRADFIKLLRAADLINFCGGSVSYLISLLQKKGFAAPISKMVKQGKLIFSGTSAGSMISADKLKLCTFDEEEKEFIKQMKSSRGLGLANFLLIPHCNQTDFIEYAKNIVSHLPKNPEPLVLINDKQAVWVVDKTFEILTV